MTIDTPGVYPLTAAEYHADKFLPEPSLSASIAFPLLDQSPKHAMAAHPLLNPDYEPEESEAFDLGKAAHKLVLEGDSAFVLLDFADFKKKEAQEQRDAARKAGRIPLLRYRWYDVQRMAEALKLQLARHQDKPIPLTGGKPEQTLVWREGDVWCRARLDWLHATRRAIDDYKTTSGSASPDSWTRGALFANGYDLQAAFYLRGVAVLFGVEATFRFVVQETYAPFACSVIGLSPDVLVLGEKKRRLAVELWGWCVRTNQWPGYPTRTCYATLPPYIEAAWLEREMREERPAVVDDGQRDIAEVI